MINKINGFASDGMDEPRAADNDFSAYTFEEKSEAPTHSDAYTEPEENLINIVSVGLGAVSVRSRPPKDEWFRSHTDGSMSTGMRFLKGKMGELYALHPALIPFAGEEVRKALFTASVTACMTIDGAKFLWAILHPSGNSNHQHYENAMEARSLSRSTWVRFYWDERKESHVTVTPKTNPTTEPEWPQNFTLGDWIEKAFKGRFIDTMEHQIIRKIRGDL